jgi:hypothetical protein
MPAANNYAIYEITTGKVIRICRCQPTMILHQLQDGEAYLATELAAEETFAANYYIDTVDYDVLERPDGDWTVVSSINGEGHFELTFTVDIPALITINNTQYEETDDGTFVFETDIPMTARWKVECFPFKTQQGVVELG